MCDYLWAGAYSLNVSVEGLNDIRCQRNAPLAGSISGKWPANRFNDPVAASNKVIEGAFADD